MGHQLPTSHASAPAVVLLAAALLLSSAAGAAGHQADEPFYPLWCRGPLPVELQWEQSRSESKGQSVDVWVWFVHNNGAARAGDGLRPGTCAWGIGL